MNDNKDIHQYNDIINLPHHQSATRPHMSNYDRAAQFSPFAALTGHDEAIKETARLTDRKIEIDEYTKDDLNIKLQIIDDNPGTEVIDTVCEWNYELILDADAHRNDPKDFKDYSEYQDKYDSLKADEKRLDRLFEKTCYAKEIDEMAAALVESFISHLSSRDDLEKAAVTVAEGIKDYSTGKRGR